MSEFEKVVSIKYFVFERMVAYATYHGYSNYVEEIKIVFPSADSAKNFLADLKQKAIKVVEEGGSLPYKEPDDYRKSGVIFASLNYVPFYSAEERVAPETCFPPAGFEIWDEARKEYFLDKWSIRSVSIEEEE